MHTTPSNKISYLGRSNYRNDGIKFGIKQGDRLSHIHIIGKTGTGKSTLIETLIRQDIEAGRGFALIDPHGDLAARVAALVPEGRHSTFTYLNVPDPTQPFGYNPLRHVRPDKIPLAAAGLIEAFKKIWSDAWGVRMEHILRCALYALLERPGSTLNDILRMLSDRTFRKEVAEPLSNPPVRAFWLQEFEKYSFGYRSDGAAPIQNKVGALLANPTLNRILTKPTEDIRIRKIMDDGGILVVNLARGLIGEDSATLLGALIVTTIGLAAFSRADMPAAQRCDFFLYIDEFQNFTTLALANMASELRKYGVGLTLAHQHLHQLEPDIRHAIMGNMGTLISFRVGPEDTAILTKEFLPKFDTEDLLNLPNYQMYLKLMIDGVPSPPFSAVSLRPSEAS
ncbi:type IV secretion system DNA-binding domain-containing protein [Dongia sp.]|uniref:type IV secretory system conjugative DNA transfer family protein n=1 Tax=Dongia sp. TaxID=1977262 RepID=UPI0035B4BBEE